MKSVSVVFSDKIYNQIKKEGEKEERKVSTQIRFIVTEYFKKDEEGD